ncbi:MAG: cytidylyltransferase domain-containing protein [Phycisphaerales bacterium]|jgi:N-acylneuraminate cytidylyltransferase
MNARDTIVCVILARAGSRGVPGKNVAPVAGRPCIAWTIDHALASTHVATTLVSTDDPKAASVARAMGATVIDRPASLAGDAARVDDAVRHCIAAHEVASGPVDGVVILYGNVPVRPEGLIDRAIERFRSSGCDSVQSYAPVGKHHPWWTARLEGDEMEARAWEDGAILNHGVYRRQDLPPAYIPDGGVLVVSRAALFGEIPGAAPGPHAFFGARRAGVVNAEGSVVDIDAPIDLLVADAILSRRVAHAAA